MELILPLVLEVGQCQLLRRQIANELNITAKVDSDLLCNALKALNESAVNDVRKMYRDPQSAAGDRANIDNNLFVSIEKYSQICGMPSTFSKIYVTGNTCERLPVVLLLVSFAAMSKLKYDKDFGTLVAVSSKSAVDGTPVAAGIATVLKQFHPSYTSLYLQYLGQFLRTSESLFFSFC